MTISFSINMMNPFRAKIFLTVAETNDETCSMAVMKYLLNWFFVSSNKSLFQNENELFDKKMINSAIKKNDSLKSFKNQTKIFILSKCRNISQNNWTAEGRNTDIEMTKFKNL